MFRPIVAIIRFYHFDSLKIILYNSRGGLFDEEISTSKPLLERSTCILGVWVGRGCVGDKKLMMATTGRNM